MKIKNGILATISILLSAGAVFASLSMVTPDYVHVQYTETSDFVCTTAPTCAGGISTCLIRMTVDGTPRNTPIYDNSACTQPRLSTETADWGKGPVFDAD